MNIVLVFLLILNSVMYTCSVLISNLKILQLEEYSYIKLIKYNYKKYNLFYLTYVLILPILVLSFYIFKIYLLNIFLIVYLSILFISYLVVMIRNIYNKIKPRFTKRIIRIFILFVLFQITTLFITISNCSMFLFSILLTIILIILTISSNYLIYIFEYILSITYAKYAIKKLNNQEILKIAITGSYGKTSVKNILSTILSEKYSVLITPKSYNTLNGITMTIRDNDLSRYNVLIMEMGAKKKGDIKKLCKNFKPQYGILTAIGKQHLETFKSLKNIIKTKEELQNNLSNNSFMVFNCNNKDVENLYLKHVDKKISAGVVNINSDSEIDLQLCAKIKKIDLEGITFDIYYKGKFYCTANTSLVGEYNVINIILAVGIAIKLGLTSNQIVNGIAKLRPVESRMQPICLDSGAIIINNGYNSNPNSIKESLKLLGLYKDRKKIVITPGFVEMGKEQYKLNYELGKLISGVADECYVVNKINREAILCGLKDSNFDNKIVIVNKFKEIEFSVFNSNSVILIENDLPDNYI